MTDEIDETWNEFRDKVRTVIQNHAGQDHLRAFDAWYFDEQNLVMKFNYPAPQISHVSWGLDGLRIGGDDLHSGVVDRLMAALRDFPPKLCKARSRR